MLDQKESLLEIITSKEVDDLIIEQKLIDKGYKFHYFIDQFDIANCSFPFGLIASENLDGREDKSIEVVTDEQISYDYILNIRNEKLLLFDEHREELQNLSRKIDRVKNFGIEIIDSFKIQSEYFEQLSEGKAITFEAWSRNQELSSELNVSLLISIALGSIRTGIENLNRLQKDKLIVAEDDYKELGFKTIISAFSECRPKQNTDLLFEALIKSYSERQTPQRLIARYKKCKVFDRIICVNNKSKKNKEIFLLLSSAKSINSRLPKVANNLGIGLEIEDQKFNPIRTIQQIYLQLLLKENAKKSEELEKIKEILLIKEKDADASKSQHYNELILRYFEEEFTSLREGYENASLLLKIKDYEKLFNEALKNKKVGDLKVLSKSILGLLKIAEESEELEKLKSTSLNEIEIVRDYKQILRDSIDNISYKEGYLSAFSENDYVENAYHTIPFVFHNKGSKNFRKIIDKIIILATETTEDNTYSNKLIKSINESFELLYHKNLPNEEERIIMLLILMMIGKSDETNPDELALEWLDEMYDSGSISKEWIIDFNYIKSWLLRRLGKYKETIAIAEESLQIEKNDPRFFHAIYLGYYNLYRKTKKLDALKNAAINSLDCYNIYQQKSANVLAVKKAIIANLNSLAYLNTLLFKETQDATYLKSARCYLDKLKEADYNYYKFPEFLYTEALLELEEYKLTKEIVKLKFAQKAIFKVSKIKPKKAAYLELEEEINQLLSTK